jgi:hypothetical protein
LILELLVDSSACRVCNSRINIAGSRLDGPGRRNQHDHEATTLSDGFGVFAAALTVVDMRSSIAPIQGDAPHSGQCGPIELPGGIGTRLPKARSDKPVTLVGLAQAVTP